MKNIISALLIFIVANTSIKAQTPAEQLADRIAGKMKDSLSLTNQQKDQLYSINMQLNESKTTVRQLYNNTDSLVLKLQQVENTRDSLYGSVLTSQQFILYKQKKRKLVNNN